MMLATTDATRWELERQRWTKIFQDQLQSQLTYLVQMAQQNPNELKAHFETVKTMLQQAQQRPYLHELAADLIMALHPFPYLWGEWEAWLTISRRSVALFAGLQRSCFQAELLAGIVDTLFELGRFDDAITVFEEMWLLSMVDGVIRPLIRAGHRVSTRLMLAGRMDEAILHYERQCDLFSEKSPNLLPEDVTYIEIYLILQETLLMRREGRQQEAVLKIEAVITRLVGWPDAPLDLCREVHHHHGGIRLSTSEFVLSTQAMDRAIQCAVKMDDPFTEASLYVDKSFPLWALGKYAQAETAVRRGIYLCEQLNASWRLITGVSVLVSVFITKGDFEEALYWNERLILLSQQSQNEMEEYNAKTTMGIILLNLGFPEQGKGYLQECLPVYQDKKIIRWLSLAESNLSWCWADLGDVKRGEKFAQQAIAHAQEMDAANLEGIAWRSLSRFQTGQEKWDSLLCALAFAEKNNIAFAKAGILLELVALCKDETERFVFWEQAVALLHDMELEGWLNGRSLQNPPCLPLIA